GRALGVVGGVIGAESDRRAGMDATEAYTTNAIGTAAGIAAGALIGTFVGPPVIVTAVLATGAGMAATRIAKWTWNNAANKPKRNQE
ncbi:hypothetical protein, partial [Corynebacterium zhongnanshanii]|uniref:hypothetical protein n=1 Tax=Corynebacterium zhongnanshanii TaxID=2768834 RepID=UPI0039C9C397